MWQDTEKDKQGNLKEKYPLRTPQEAGKRLWWLPHGFQLDEGKRKMVGYTALRTVWVVSSTSAPASDTPGTRSPLSGQVRGCGHREKEQTESPQPRALPVFGFIQPRNPNSSSSGNLWLQSGDGCTVGVSAAPRVRYPSRALGLLSAAGNDMPLKYFRGCLAARTTVDTVAPGYKLELFLERIWGIWKSIHDTFFRNVKGKPELETKVESLSLWGKSQKPVCNLGLFIRNADYLGLAEHRAATLSPTLHQSVPRCAHCWLQLPFLFKPAHRGLQDTDLSPPPPPHPPSL